MFSRYEILAVALGALGILIPSNTAAQQKTVAVNLAAEAFTGSVPYWEHFVIQGSLPDEATGVLLVYDQGQGRVRTAEWTRAMKGYDAGGFSIPGGPLHPDRSYTFCFAVFGRLPRQPAGLADEGEELLNLNRSCNDILPDSAKRRRNVHRFAVTASPRSQWAEHFDTDLGVMRTAKVGYTGVVTGAHFYLVPVRKDLDLIDPFLTRSQEFWRRISFYAGVSPVQLYSTADQPIKGTPVGIPVVGIGFRGPLYWRPVEGLPGQFLQQMRLNAGVMFYEQDDENPIIEEDRAKRDVFLSLTVDLAIRDVIGPLAAALGLK
jgi:hypothetical protein